MDTMNKNKPNRFTGRMQKKLLVFFIVILAAFVGLSVRLYVIARDNGEEYKMQVLSQQEYDSTTIPYKRGEILDANGLVLAASNKVYNVILDCKVMLSKEDYLEPTLAALHSAFGTNIAETRAYVQEHPDSQYYVLYKKKSYDEIIKFTELQKDTENYPNIKGVWFEDEYERQYPNGSLACDVIGFATADSASSYGLEAYYNGLLTGNNGREYGYLNEDSTLERTTISAEDGYSLVTTIDSNIQSIVEKYLEAFNDEYKDNRHAGNGAENVGCVIMKVDTGEVLAMASYPFFDLNNPRDTSALIGMRQVDKDGKKTTGERQILVSADGRVVDADEVQKQAAEIIAEEAKRDAEVSSDDAQEPAQEDAAAEQTVELTDSVLDLLQTVTVEESLYITEDSLKLMNDEELYQNLNNMWKNFCISNTYEPGSVAKPFTVASALDCGSITGNEYYNCEGKLHVGDYDIKCHNIYGDGYLSVTESIERSCNVGLMNVAFSMGIDKFLTYQSNFGFGLKTNIDLAGEARTASLVYDKKSMRLTELATNSFGQGFNVTMIQTIAGFCSLINGGYFYEPHVVSKIMTADGATIQNIEPRIMKQTISNSTSQMIKEMCNTVVTGDHGTGKTARPAGYMIGGKTGTAETLPRGNGDYVVSFMGYAPADDPEIAIYVVVDRPNVYGQDDAKYATRIVRNILTEVLPYLHIYMTEELTEKEKQELEEKNLEDTTALGRGGIVTDTTEEENAAENASNDDSTETKTDSGSKKKDTDADSGGEQTVTPEEIPKAEEPWKDFPIDTATGYAVDPNTGAYVDPVTGAAITGDNYLPEDFGIASGGDESALGDEPDVVQ